MTEVIMAARLSGTEDKIRVRFLQCGQLSEKVQDGIKDVIWKKWQQLVTIVRWPRNNIVELKLSRKMIRSAGFLEIKQELAAFWKKVLESIERATELAKATTKRCTE